MAFDFLKRHWPVLALFAIVGYAVIAAYGKGVATGRAEVTANWVRAQGAYDAAVRAKEDAYAAARGSAAAIRDEELKNANADIARVHADRDRLRKALADAVGRIPAENGRTPGGAGGTGAVLADVCSRAGETAAILAAYADRERIARQDCQRAWPR